MESIDTETGTSASPELSTSRVRRIFSKIAPTYERFNSISSFGADSRWLAKMVSVSSIDGDDAVLDVAGGTGEVTFAFCKGAHPREVMCTDLVPEMLQIAEEHYSKGASEGVPVRFEVADGQDLPFEDETFDAVTMAYGLRNMPQREVALKQALRVLKPGGEFVCLDFSTPKNPVWRALYGLYLRHVIPFWGQVICKDRSGFVYLAKSIRAFPDQEALAKMLTDAGFQDVRYYDCTGGIACIHVCKKPQAALREHEAL